MNSRNRILLWAATIAAVAIGGGLTAWHIQSRRVLAAATAELPGTPDLAKWPAAMRDRIAHCETRIRGDRDARVAWEELSRLYHANGFSREASTCYRALLVLDPRNPLWVHRAAAILAGYGDLPRALPLLRRAVALDARYLPAAIRLGDALFKLGDSAEAERVYAGVLQRDPANALAIAGLARVEMNAGRLSQARDRLERISAQTRFGTALDLLATVYDRLQQSERATQVRTRIALTRVFRDLPDPWIDELAADCFDPYLLSVAAAAAENFGDAPGAIRWLERALSVAPADASLHRQLGQILMARREYTKARGHFQHATSLAPDEPDNWVQLVLMLVTVGDAGAIERALADGLAACPTSPALHLEKGRHLKAKGQHEEALREFAESSRLRPYEADAFIESAHLYFRQGQTEFGVAQLRQALNAVPGHPVATYFLAMHAIDAGDETTAVRLIQQARQQPKFRAEELAALTSAFRERFGKLP